MSLLKTQSVARVWGKKAEVTLTPDEERRCRTAFDHFDADLKGRLNTVQGVSNLLGSVGCLPDAHFNADLKAVQFRVIEEEGVAPGARRAEDYLSWGQFRGLILIRKRRHQLAMKDKERDELQEVFEALGGGPKGEGLISAHQLASNMALLGLPAATAVPLPAEEEECDSEEEEELTLGFPAFCELMHNSTDLAADEAQSLIRSPLTARPLDPQLLREHSVTPNYESFGGADVSESPLATPPGDRRSLMKRTARKVATLVAAFRIRGKWGGQALQHQGSLDLGDTLKQSTLIDSSLLSPAASTIRMNAETVSQPSSPTVRFTRQPGGLSGPSTPLGESDPPFVLGPSLPGRTRSGRKHTLHGGLLTVLGGEEDPLPRRCALSERLQKIWEGHKQRLVDVALLTVDTHVSLRGYIGNLLHIEATSKEDSNWKYAYHRRQRRQKEYWKLSKRSGYIVVCSHNGNPDVIATTGGRILNRPQFTTTLVSPSCLAEWEEKMNDLRHTYNNEVLDDFRSGKPLQLCPWAPAAGIACVVASAMACPHPSIHVPDTSPEPPSGPVSDTHTKPRIHARSAGRDDRNNKIIEEVYQRYCGSVLEKRKKRKKRAHRSDLFLELYLPSQPVRAARALRRAHGTPTSSEEFVL